MVGKTGRRSAARSGGPGLRRASRQRVRERPGVQRDGAKYEVQTTPDGPAEQRFLDFVYQPIKDAAGAVTGIFVLGADVTVQTQAYYALRESEASFRSALKAGRMGSWETDYPTRTRIWSQEGMALFGLDLVDGRGRIGGADDEYVAALHPEDRHLAQRFRELAEQQDAFAAEYRSSGPTARRSGCPAAAW